MRFKRNPSERFWEKVEKTDGCWFWIGGKYYNGYGQFFNGVNKVTAHRFAYIDTYGSFPKELLVCHKCDVRNCVNPKHLFLGTQQDNLRDMVKKGRNNPRDSSGTKNGMAKISEIEVKQIRTTYKKGGISAKKLGSLYGIGESQTLRIINKESWTKV